MNWDDLKVLLALSRAGSTRKAAAILAVSNTTVMRRLESLEEQVSILTGAAAGKFAELDADGSGKLDGDELLLLAEWVWASFHPGGAITDEQREAEARKLLHRCDNDTVPR